MKKLLYLLAALFVFSCGKKDKVSTESIIASKDIESIREQKKTLTAKQQALGEEIEKLSAAIAEIDPNQKIPLVTTVIVKDTLFNHYIELQGNVQTKQNLVLTPEFNGILSNVYVKEGQQVQKGQLLAKVDDGGLSQQLGQLEVQRDLAKTTFERQERLWNQKIGSEIQFLQAKTNYQAQQKAIGQLNKSIAKTTIRAPFSGVVDDIITEKGNVVAAGQSPILRIVSLNNMYIEAEVPERYISNIKKGTNVTVEIPVLNTSIDTQIKQSGSFINPGSRTYTIEVPVKNKEKTIKPNLTAKLLINDYSSDKAILVPQNLLSENAEGDQYVYKVVKDSDNSWIAKQQVVKTGKSQGDLIEIKSGLTVNTVIIEEGARSVVDNQIIQLLN